MGLRGDKKSKSCFALLFLLLVANGSLRAGTVVAPAGTATVEGNINNVSPFGIGVALFPSQRYQQVYSSAAFFGVFEITDIAFRPDFEFGAAFSTTLANVQIDLSTTSAAVGALSFTFANNVGADDTVVASGPLSLSSSFTGPAGGPKNFDILIHLKTPFLYNPANGNLLMDVRNFSGGTTTFFDAVNTPGGGTVSRLYTDQTGSVNSATANGSGPQGLVTEFLSIPEPASIALLLSGGLALAAFAQRLLTLNPSTRRY